MTCHDVSLARGRLATVAFIFWFAFNKIILHPKHKIQDQFQTLNQNACYFTPEPYMGTLPH